MNTHVHQSHTSFSFFPWLSRMSGFAVLCLVALSTGCASMSTVETADPTQGSERRFEASYDETVGAAVQAVASLAGLTIEEKREVDSGTMLLASKPMGWDTGAAFVRVFIEKSDGPLTTVRVVSAKRYKLEISGPAQRHYAQAVFHNIAVYLGQK